MRFQKAKKKKTSREELQQLKNPERSQPRRKKEQIMWKKLGYHGNFVNTKKTC